MEYKGAQTEEIIVGFFLRRVILFLFCHPFKDIEKAKKNFCHFNKFLAPTPRLIHTAREAHRVFGKCAAFQTKTRNYDLV
jgi:hypothetical protein